MDYHDTCCPCAYCDLEREEKAEATIRRTITGARVGLLLVLLGLAAWIGA